jgi:hypothetical protein
VPDSWSVINDQDLGEQYIAVQYHAAAATAARTGVACPSQLAASCLAADTPAFPACHPRAAVAKSAKFVLLFKRPGNVVIVNPQGDLIVNPQGDLIVNPSE